MINSELLKEAIADAKAVRVTAYANAKASLQERFDKRFEAVFAEKLRAEAEEEDESMMQEVEAPNQVSGTGGEAKGPKTKAVSKGQPKKVSDGSTNFKTVHMGQGPTDVPSADNKMEESYEEEEESKMDESGFSSDDLDEIIKELEQEVGEEEEGQRVEEPSFPPRPNADANALDAAAGEADPHAGKSVDLSGAADAEAGEADDAGKMPGAGSGEDAEADLARGDADAAQDDAETAHGDADAAGLEAGAADAEADAAGPVPPQFGQEDGQQIPPQFPQKGAEGQEEISLEELLAALNEEAEEEDDKVDEGKLPPWLKKKGDKKGKDKDKDKDDDDEKMDEITNNGVPKNVGGQDKTGGTNTYPKASIDASRRIDKGHNHNIQGRGNIGTGSDLGKPMREVARYQVALKESYNTIEFLRGQINEVNLLNAKLLYTNKLFKEFASVIDEPYRMKIVEAFDLTKSVREVKLAYALLAESLNFGSKRVILSRPVQKSDPTKRAIVRQITEGYASKPVASTRPVQVINGSTNVMVARLQKLAGIKLPVANAKK